MKIPIGGMMKFSTIDFPGVLSCVLFVRGCDLDCFYCHNRGLLSPGENLPWEEVLAFLQKRRGMLDGVVVSGGEPTLYPELPQLLETLRSLDYRVKLDTNGLKPRAVEELIAQKLVDYVAVDWKAPREAFGSVCGGAPEDQDRVRETLELLAGSGIPFEARTTLYPGLEAGELLELARTLPPLPRYRLNYYRHPQEFREADAARLDRHALTPDEVKLLRAGLLEAQPNCILE